MRDLICTALPWLSLGLALLGMRNWDARIPASFAAIIMLLWGINWLLNHVSLRWLRYLRILFWVGVVVVIIVVPELRALFEEVVTGLLTLESQTLLVLAMVTLLIWGVMCLARPATRANEE